MKSKLILFTLALGAMLCGCSRNWGETEYVMFPLNEPFTELEISDGFVFEGYDPNIHRTEDACVVVGQKALGKVKLEVKNGRLYVGFSSGNFNTGKQKPRVILPYSKIESVATLVLRENSVLEGSTMATSLTSLRSITLSDNSKMSGDLFLAWWNEEGTAMVGALNIDVESGSSIDAEILVPDVNITLSDGSRAKIATVYHDVETLNIDVRSGSNLTCVASNISGTISGGSTVTATCCNTLSVNVTEGSTLSYHLGDGCELSTYDCHSSDDSAITQF